MLHYIKTGRSTSVLSSKNICQLDHTVLEHKVYKLQCISIGPIYARKKKRLVRYYLRTFTRTRRISLWYHQTSWYKQRNTSENQCASAKATRQNMSSIATQNTKRRGMCRLYARIKGLCSLQKFANTDGRWDTYRFNNLSSETPDNDEHNNMGNIRMARRGINGYRSSCL